MKMLRALLVAVLAVGLPGVAETVKTMPAPTGYIDDYAGVLSAEGKADIDAICHDVHQKTKAQIFFVTVKTLDGESVETFANDLYHQWKIGEKKTDRGALVLLAVNDHKWRIEVGYGLEGILPDAEVGRIGRMMVPTLKAEDYDQAARIAVVAVATAIADDAKVELDVNTQPVETAPPPAVVGPPPSSESPYFGLIMGCFVVLFFGGLGLFIWITARNRLRYGRTYDPATNTWSSFSSGDSSSFGSSDSSSSDSFSGGDGGDSGGGGASGDW